MMSTAEEHPNILLHVAPFDHDKSYNPLQSFATYALSLNVFIVQCCRKKHQTTYQHLIRILLLLR